MAKSIKDCNGAVVYFAVNKDRKTGETAMTYTVHYKGESKWVNNDQDLIDAIHQIAHKAIFGHQGWKLGQDGWHKDDPSQQ